jgi:hypothetical protein
MNVNGKDITMEDMMVMLEKLQSSWCNFMYTCISDDKTFLKDMPGTNYKKRRLLDELIEHSNTGNQLKVRELLLHIVPEFNPQSPVIDLLFKESHKI